MTRFHKVPLAALLLAAPAPVFAHAFLNHASPGAGATVAAPSDVTLSFTEPVEPRFSTVTVRDAAGAKVGTSAPSTGEGGRVLIVPLPHLAPGRYTVDWHVVSVDTHRTEGRFQFTVAP
jgi:methionine-rich copper-binding protein CopC